MSRDKQHIKILKKQALELWSQIIRSKGICEYCGKPSRRLNAHHILSKKHYPEFIFELQNGICLCWSHHRYYAHLESVAFSFFLEKYFPEKYQWACAHYTDKQSSHFVSSFADNEIDALEEIIRDLNRVRLL